MEWGIMDRRFRCSIYVDIFVPETNDLEGDRDRAREMLEQKQKEIPNSYIGGVAKYSRNLLKPLDREI